MMRLLAAAAVAGLLSAGCTSTPCRQIEDAGWTCALNITEPLAPGDLIWVGPDGRVVSAGLSPGDLGRRLDERPVNIAAETRTRSWTFDLGVGLPAVAGLRAVPGAAGRLSAASVREITLTFRDSRVRGLAAELDDFRAARARAEDYLALMSVPQRNMVRRRAASAGGEIWLVMQTLESKVDGTFRASDAAGPSIAGLLSGLATEAGGTFKDDRAFTIAFDRVLPIGYRALPLALPEVDGPQSAEPWRVDPAARRMSGPASRRRRPQAAARDRSQRTPTR